MYSVSSGFQVQLPETHMTDLIVPPNIFWSKKYISFARSHFRFCVRIRGISWSNKKRELLSLFVANFLFFIP